ncbi:MAG: type IV toxin-antitoxin system AbiEi family antitoxin domain-containing protein [Bradymonadia bacterium]
MHHSDDTITFLQQKIEQHMKLVRLYRAALSAELTLRGDDASMHHLTQSGASPEPMKPSSSASARTQPDSSVASDGSARLRILEWMKQKGHPVRAREISEALEMKRTTISSELVRAEDAGQLKRVARGLYALR